MTTTSRDDLDRTSGRFVRNLALSLSGGALLTLLGATAAHAQDAAQANSDSSGTGAAHSGDANAVGNQSGTNQTQTVTVSGNLGTIQVINQQANVSNTGAAVANTGGNIAIGNSSNNTAAANQQAGVGGSAVNNGQAGNGSNGSATISTGNASAVGNNSNTVINQQANGSAHGQLGGILVINQNANVTNSGVALANSGGNFARGNDSDNGAALLQGADAAGGIASNNGKGTNDSDGKATINTGNASATGNHSDTSITQSATGSAGGELGGLVIINQNAFVQNEGVAVANTGLNRAQGNTSDNTAGTPNDPISQKIGTPLNPVFDPVGVASNNGEASNWSDGTAGITTGDAGAVGNDSTTNINQSANADVQGDGGLTLVNQNSTVLNQGIALANSGANRARGNNSDNTADLDQVAPSSGALDVGVIGNFGKAANESDGTADISSGGAYAAGNRSRTDVAQSAVTNGGGLNLYTQGNVVTNTGIGIANSGLNRSRGNTSENNADVNQTGAMDTDDVGVGVVGQFGQASNASDGSATIHTGDATAVGNESKTTIGQSIDPNGLVIPIQTAAVVNAGLGVANTGGNFALGNDSTNNANLKQDATIGDNSTGVDIDAGTLVQSNNGEASNTSDGRASIWTGNAAATGNSSNTAISQDSTGSVDGLGLVLNTQTAAVANIGVGVANSGLNAAAGNVGQSDATGNQRAKVGSDNNGNNASTDITAGILTNTNNGTASNTSDGSANVATGDARATGNRSATRISQSESASVDGIGGVINTQVAVVGNVGIGVANSGANLAIGNDSNNGADLTQRAVVGSNNSGANSDTDVIAGTLTNANDGEASNTSDGSANITTGTADATGNASATELVQSQSGDVNGLGLVVNTQVGGVLNAGVGIANSGANLAVGNASDNDGQGDGANLNQDARVGSNNTGAGADTDITVFGPLVNANQGTASNTSDGTANIRTGGAQAQGNVSTTALSQAQDGTVDKLGLVLNTQAAGVANVGVGVANSGLNAAAGNISENGNSLGQTSDVGSGNPGGAGADITVLGPLVNGNSGEASNTSDGTANVGTGGALASGNVSATNVYQHQTSDVKEIGLVVGTQVGGVANVGLAVANSGLNAAVGNASDNDANATQNADFVSNTPTPQTVTVVGPLIGNNSGQATNTSDGEACVCTGNAVASGNVSSTTLIQDLDTSVGSGVAVITEAGGVLNAGLGIANSGLNLAIGNISDNTATSTQNSTINDALDPIVGPQVSHNGGGANNASAGTGKVGSGNATATGNASTTNFVQAAAVDTDFAVATLAGGTTNTGLGLANSGLNLGIGNASTNDATLTQNADGAGIVSNDGTADNASDGTAQIGNPDCAPTVPGTTTPGSTTPGASTLPKTGGPLEAEALFGLMLLLAGFGLRRKGNSLA